MRTIITLVFLLIVGFIGARGFENRVTHRLSVAGLFATGMEFFVIGVLFGPGALNLITVETISGLEPILYLALGWIGVLFGIELSWAHVRKIARPIFRLLFVDTIFSVTVFSVAMYIVLHFLWPGLTVRQLAVDAMIFGITAAVSSPTIIAVATQRLRSRGPLTTAIRVCGALSSLFPLLCFGLLFMLVHPRMFGLEGIGYGALWWLLTNLVALLLGFLMVLLTQERTTDNEMLLLTIGTILLVGGLCYFLEFSALYIAMIIGFVVGNFSRKREQIFRELHLVEKTLFVGFLLIAGAMVGLPTPSVLWATLAFVVLRLVMKYFVTGSVLLQALPLLGDEGRRIGLAMSGQGVMAIAIAMDCVLASRNQSLTPVISVIAYSVLLNSLIGSGLTRWVITRSGENRPSRAATAAGGDDGTQ
jgi:Kef-type K+ transport system membrane component KefB